MVRRKALPPELVPARDAFDRVLAELEPAKVALTEALPGARMPGRPLRGGAARVRGARGGGGRRDARVEM